MISEQEAIIKILSEIETKLSQPYLTKDKFESQKQRFDDCKNCIKQNQGQNERTPLINPHQDTQNKLIKSIETKINIFEATFSTKNAVNNSFFSHLMSFTRQTKKSPAKYQSPSSYIIHQILPRDVMNIIFSFFEMSELNKLKRVSKDWRGLIQSFTIPPTPLTVQFAGTMVLINVPDDEQQHKQIKFATLQKTFRENINKNKQPIIAEIKLNIQNTTDRRMNKYAKVYGAVLLIIGTLAFVSIPTLSEQYNFSMGLSLLFGGAGLLGVTLIGLGAILLCQYSVNTVQHKYVDINAEQFFAKIEFDIEKAQPTLNQADGENKEEQNEMQYNGMTRISIN